MTGLPNQPTTLANSLSLPDELSLVWAELTKPGQRFEIKRQRIVDQAILAYASAPAALGEIWQGSADLGDRPYLVFGDERISYGEAHVVVDRIAGWLQAVGVRQGDRVGIAMRNCPEWLLIYWACVGRGIVAVGLNAWWTARELAVALAIAQTQIVFCDEDRLAMLGHHPGVTKKMITVAVRASEAARDFSWSDVVVRARELDNVTIDPDDEACIFYTSGTTGTAKGASLTHRNCINNLLNMQFAAEVQALAIRRTTGSEIDLGASARPTGLVTTPLFHVTATNCLAHPITAAGGTLVLMNRWSAAEAMRLIAAERVTTMGGVPTMTRELMSHPERGRHDLSSLATLVGGGAQMPPDLIAAVSADRIAARPSTGFGMTEASGIITAISGEFLFARPDSCGRVMPTFEVKIIDDAGMPLPIGAVGELSARGAGIIRNYLGSEAAPESATVDGWLRTGDVARIDEDGFLFVVDRKKDVIIRGGENVYCAEVEAALFHHCEVTQACVFGVPNERLGEEVGAAVVVRPDADMSAAALRTFLSATLARYKIPRFIWLLDRDLPRNATGKFLRRELQATLQLCQAA